MSSVLLGAPFESGGIIDDSDGMLDLDLAVTPTSTTQLVFRVLHKNPAAQKLMFSPSSALRQDHIAVAMYKVDSFRAIGGRDPEMSCSSAMASTSHMSLMSTEYFLNISHDEIKGKFYTCIEFATTTYSFKPGILPAHVDQQQACELVSIMIGADASHALTSIMQ